MSAVDIFADSAGGWLSANWQSIVIVIVGSAVTYVVYDSY